MKELVQFFKGDDGRRTKVDYLRNATLLSFVAGIVNIVGFLAIFRLTTNVTGHFAMFVHELNNGNYWEGINYIFFIFSFLLGSFSSGFILAFFRRSKKINIYIIPVLIEIMILFIVILLTTHFQIDRPNVIAGLLLFAMGMQNAYVTKISRAVVRTTHVTGLFTDLGIALSNMLTNKNYLKRKKTRDQLKVYVGIILFFFFGGLIGEIGYIVLGYGIRTLYLAIFALIFYLLYDLVTLYFRKIQHRILR